MSYTIDRFTNSQAHPIYPWTSSPQKKIIIKLPIVSIHTLWYCLRLCFIFSCFVRFALYCYCRCCFRRFRCCRRFCYLTSSMYMFDEVYAIFFLYVSVSWFFVRSLFDVCISFLFFGCVLHILLSANFHRLYGATEICRQNQLKVISISFH